MPKYKTNQKQLYHARFQHDIFQCFISIAWCEDSERLEKLIARNDTENPTKIKKGTACCFYLNKNGNHEPCILMPFKWNPSDPQLISLLSHECLHAIISLFRYKEIPMPKDIHHKENDEENLLYNHQWIFQACLYAMKEQDKHKMNFEEEVLIK